MIVLGLLLVIIAGVVGTDIVLENTRGTTGMVFQQTVTGLSLGGVFLAGAVTALVLALGLWLLFRGAARARRRRVEAKRTQRSTAAERQDLAAENERLARKLEEERAARQSAPVSPYDDESRGAERESARRVE
jgi:uncharacterized protein HemX